MSDKAAHCVVWTRDPRTWELVEAIPGNHEWVTSYTGNTRRCRVCNRLERLNTETTATQDKTA